MKRFTVAVAVVLLLCGIVSQAQPQPVQPPPSESPNKVKLEINGHVLVDGPIPSSILNGVGTTAGVENARELVPYLTAEMRKAIALRDTLLQLPEGEVSTTALQHAQEEADAAVERWRRNNQVLR